MPLSLVSIVRSTCWGLALGAAAALPAQAQVGQMAPTAAMAPMAQAAAADASGIDASTRRWLDDEVARSLPMNQTAPLRMEVSVGALDSRLRLAPCGKVEPYVPTGMRLWGKTSLGLRCVDGPVRWNVFLPVQVKAFGPAWVARGGLVAGSTINPADLMQVEVDWAEEPSPVLADPAQFTNVVLTRSLNPGQALRQSMVRAAVAFEAGANVRIVAQGQGFSVVADGQAVSPGVVGQSARVRMEGGRMITGTVLDAHTVKVDI